MDNKENSPGVSTSSVESPNTGNNGSPLAPTAKLGISDNEKSPDLSSSPSVSFIKLTTVENNQMEKCPGFKSLKLSPNYISSKEDSVRSWIDTQDPKIYRQTCFICNKLFFNREQYEEHKEPKAYGCTHCPKSFPTKISTYNHIVVTHIKRAKCKRHVCKDCGIAYKKKASLTRHAVLHWDEISRKRNQEIWDNECGLCHRRFFNLALLNTHLYMKHSSLARGDKPYECSSCDEAYKTEIERLKHDICKHFSFRRP